jgi:hypothetical protein
MGNVTVECAPIEYVIVELPTGACHLPGEVAAELATLEDNGFVHVLDVLILVRDQQGRTDAMELEDLEALEELRDLRELRDRSTVVLAEADVEPLGAALEPGTSAGVVVWENLWVRPLCSAVQRSGSRPIAGGPLFIPSG